MTEVRRLSERERGSAGMRSSLLLQQLAAASFTQLLLTFTPTAIREQGRAEGPAEHTHRTRRREERDWWQSGLSLSEEWMGVESSRSRQPSCRLRLQTPAALTQRKDGSNCQPLLTHTHSLLLWSSMSCPCRAHRWIRVHPFPESRST